MSEENKVINGDATQQTDVKTTEEKVEKTGFMTKVKSFFSNVWGKIVGFFGMIKNKIFRKKENDEKADESTEAKKASKKELTPEELEIIKQKKIERQEKNKVAREKTINFITSNILTQKMLNIVLLVLSIAIVVFGVLEVGFMSYGVATNIDVILEIFKTKDVLAIIELIFILSIVIIVFIQTIMSLVSIISKKKRFNLTILSTLIGFYVAVMFFKNEISVAVFDALGFSFRFLNVIAIISLVYAFMDLLNGNFKDRIFTIVCAGLCSVVVILLFSTGAINFISYNVDQGIISLKDVNIIEYITGISEYFTTGEITMVSETTRTFILAFAENIFESPALVMQMLSLVLNFIILLSVKIFPYMALSILGYVVIVISSAKGRQIYTLKYAKKIAVSLLVFAILTAVCAVALHFIKILEGGITFDVINVVYSILGPIVVMILAWLPMWRVKKVNAKKITKFS